jgi:hypothetical protein
MVTHEQMENYIKGGGDKCPKCESNNITGGHVEIDWNEAVQGVFCGDCEFEWDDVYILSEIRFEDNSPLQEDPAYPRSDWQHEVADGCTLRGYWEWVESQREQEMHEKGKP